MNVKKIITLLLAHCWCSLAACGTKGNDERTQSGKMASPRMPRKRLPCTRS